MRSQIGEIRLGDNNGRRKQKCFISLVITGKKKVNWFEILHNNMLLFKKYINWPNYNNLDKLISSQGDAFKIRFLKLILKFNNYNSKIHLNTLFRVEYTTCNNYFYLI